MSTTFTILGCGSSMGVPRVALGWGACDPANPKNRRRRCSLMVQRRSEAGATRVLVDCSPDLREQMLAAEVDSLDGVLLTHDHADHTHGIDDLRPLFVRQRAPIALHMAEPTARSVVQRFSYCFETSPGSDYPPTLSARSLSPGQPVTIAGKGGPIVALPLLQNHGPIDSIGFRFGNVAYSADLKALPPESEAALAGLDLWIVDALRYQPHSSHLNVDEALALIARLKPKRAVLINLHADLDYEELRAKLPPGVVPGYDGMNLSDS